jgi:1,2-diacylglycerol 3-beta-galactosyltransferase
MQRVDLVYFDAGGGHRAAANALLQVIGGQKRPWDVRMINLQELLDPLDIFRKITGLRLEDLYNAATDAGDARRIAAVSRADGAAARKVLAR